MSLLTVNLFDDAFRHDVCSVAGKTPRYIQYVRDQFDWPGITLFTDGYVVNGQAERVNSKYKIGWLHEPECLHPENYQNIPVNSFDLIFTYYQPLLDQGPPFVFAPYGGVWIPREHWGLKPKTKLCSMLYGDKTATPLHRMRHEIVANIERYNLPVDLFGPNHTQVGYGLATKRLVLEDYAFSIVTETCRQEGLFTEWLLDCFAVGTVPIFCGCPDMGKYFNWRGVYPFLEARDIDKISMDVLLSFDAYDSLLPAVQDNFERVAQYEITEDWLFEKVLRELE